MGRVLTTFVALLRAVNVSGKNRVPMAALRAMLAGLGFGRVETYLQSGNAAFDADADADAARALATAIEMRIKRDIGPRVGVLVMPAVALAAVAEANPLARDPGVDEKWLHATFLFESTAESDFGSASEVAFSANYETEFGKLALPAEVGEQAAYVGLPDLTVPVIYLCLPHGYGRTKLTNAYFERKLGAATTTRNWRTVLALAEMSARAS